MVRVNLTLTRSTYKHVHVHVQYMLYAAVKSPSIKLINVLLKNSLNIMAGNFGHCYIYNVHVHIMA